MIIFDFNNVDNLTNMLLFCCYGIVVGVGLVTVGYIIGLTVNFIYRLLKNKI